MVSFVILRQFGPRSTGDAPRRYHGSKQHRADLRKTAMRKAHQNDDDFPVIVTSYEICILDRAALSHFKFKYLVIDEGQRVKNRDCRLVRELKKLDTENRLLLSGTPIQNTLEELWSLLNFVNPQIFDDLAVFQSWFGFRNIGQETQVDDIVDDESKDRRVSASRDTPSTRLVSIREGAGWSLFRFRTPRAGSSPSSTRS